MWNMPFSKLFSLIHSHWGEEHNYNLLKFLEKVNTDSVFSIVLAKTFSIPINFTLKTKKTNT